MQNFILFNRDRSELYRIVRAVDANPKRYEIQSTENPTRVGEVFYDRKEVVVRDSQSGQSTKTYTGKWKLVKQEIYQDSQSITGDKVIRYVAIEDPNINIYLITTEMVPYFEEDIEAAVISNTNYRKVVYTSERSQVVYMSLSPGQLIPQETHNVDQFFRVEQGSGIAELVLNGQTVVMNLSESSAFVVPAGTLHTVVNTGPNVLKLYTVYSGATHLAGLTEQYPL